MKTLLTMFALVCFSTVVVAQSDDRGSTDAAPDAAKSAQQGETVQDTDSEPWFDMQNCDICKCMGEDMSMFAHVKWETHKIPTGMLTVTVVDEDYQEAWAAIEQKYEAAMAKFMENPTELNCSQFCQSMRRLMEAGVEKTELQTAGGKVVVFTSVDPAVVEAIHAHADRTIAECAKFQEMMEGTGSSGEAASGGFGSGGVSAGDTPGAVRVQARVRVQSEEPLQVQPAKPREIEIREKVEVIKE